MTRISRVVYHPSDILGEMPMRDRVKELPEILECYHLTREFDYLLKVVVRDRQKLETVLSQTLAQIHSVERIRPNIVLNQVKASTSLPLD